MHNVTSIFFLLWELPIEGETSAQLEASDMSASGGIQPLGLWPGCIMLHQLRSRTEILCITSLIVVFY